jgi:hypothetical protein
MINISSSLTNLFKEQSSITVQPGARIEYNMNSLLENLKVTTTSTDGDYISQVTPTIKVNPFKKLFPVDSVVKPFRPQIGGVKYYIATTSEYPDIAAPYDNYSTLRVMEYPSDLPRVYYAGDTNEYKYFVTPIGKQLDVTVSYVNTNSTKTAFINKIVATFEKFHYVPDNCNIYIKLKNQSETLLGNYSIPENGKLILHYVDKAVDGWESGDNDIYANSLGAEFKYATPLEIESLRISGSNQSGSIIGLIELSGRLVKDISEDIVSMEVKKEASANSEDILPIGKVSSNSLSLSLAKYEDNSEGAATLQVKNYNIEDPIIDPDILYMLSKAEIRTHFKVYHSNASTVLNNYDVVKQGTFYIDSWEINSYGSVSISAYDYAKILMESIAPERLYESYPATGVISGLLDSVGFTNYKFNLDKELDPTLGTTVTIDKSIPLINYWWSDGRKSVWECIQEICNDIQMNAFFDEEGVLQISSRQYIYDNTKTSSYLFTYEKDGSILPNIASFSNKEVASANQVKIIYTSPFNSNLIGSSDTLYVSPVSYLAAGALLSEITALSPGVGDAIEVQIDQMTEYNNIASPFSFTGYVVINSEIIEYDAIQYKLVNKYKTQNKVDYVWVESEADVAKYQSLAESRQYDASTGIVNVTFGPSNKLRVKQRGALGTTPAAHVKTSEAFTGGGWKAYKASWA